MAGYYGTMKDRNILNLYKVAGETPLERIKRFKIDNPDFEDVKLSYAGRLDPMAEGVLLVLAGEENKKREEYLKYSKEYTFDALFGVRTDTYDILGKVVESSDEDFSWKEIEEKIALHLVELKGKINQQYPPYSSKPVNGKPLFQWAKEDRIKDGKVTQEDGTQVDVPSNEVEIFEIGPIYTYMVGTPELAAYVFDMIGRVRGDFRQRAIIRSWLEFFEGTKKAHFHVLRIKISCSSGTYVRGIVNNLGKKLGIGAIALKIVRTKIGDYRMEEAVM